MFCHSFFLKMLQLKVQNKNSSVLYDFWLYKIFILQLLDHFDHVSFVMEFLYVISFLLWLDFSLCFNHLIMISLIVLIWRSFLVASSFFCLWSFYVDFCWSFSVVIYYTGVFQVNCLSSDVCWFKFNNNLVLFIFTSLFFHLNRVIFLQ